MPINSGIINAFGHAPKDLKLKIPKALKQNSDIKFFEMGSGSGINLKTALESGIKLKLP